MTASEAEARQKQYKRGRAEAFREAGEWHANKRDLHATSLEYELQGAHAEARDHFRKRAEEEEK